MKTQILSLQMYAAIRHLRDLFAFNIVKTDIHSHKSPISVQNVFIYIVCQLKSAPSVFIIISFSHILIAVVWPAKMLMMRIIPLC